MKNEFLDTIHLIVNDLLALPYYLRKPDQVTIKDLSVGIVSFMDRLHIHGQGYAYSKSAVGATLYNAVYILLISQLIGVKIEDKTLWCDYLDSFQEDDGMWRDKKYPFRIWPERDAEWNDIHIIPQIVYAYEFLDAIPKKRFEFLDKFKDLDYTRYFFESIDFEHFWGESNGVMNYLVAMQYARNYMNDYEFNAPIHYMIESLQSIMNMTDGIFTKSRKVQSLYEAVRGGYHVWMLMEAEGIEFEEKHVKRIIDTVLSLQNPFGGFNYRIVADTCMNIDCIDVLARFSLMAEDYRKTDVENALRKAEKYLLNNLNSDGGFCFCRIHGTRYGNDAHSTKINESGLFGTWFSLLSLCIIHDYFEEKRFLKSEIPGYEYRLKKATAV